MNLCAQKHRAAWLDFIDSQTKKGTKSMILSKTEWEEKLIEMRDTLEDLLVDRIKSEMCYGNVRGAIDHVSRLLQEQLYIAYTPREEEETKCRG